MGSTARYENLSIRVAPLNGESTLPAILRVGNFQNRQGHIMGDDNDLYIGYGALQNIYPYPHRDQYTRKLEEQQVLTAVLENDKIKATFIPSVGGKLWSLVDKTTGKELLYRNDVIRASNLAVRNAWTSGGVEWNIALVGHTPFTMEQLFTSIFTAEDGTPVIRFYEFERIRKVTYQIDFFLPDGSAFLLCRMRIVNPNHEVVPMYWWSNIAVPEEDGSRLVVPAHKAYTSVGSYVTKVNTPVLDNGIDVSYPKNLPNAVDYFFDIPDQNRRFICNLNKDGYGLVQASTSRLKGRKLFVWGQHAGSKHWQDFLTDKAGAYYEIQAGLGKTQFECIPMQPDTAWEWLEAYGPMTVDPKDVSGDYDQLLAKVTADLDSRLPIDGLEQLLKDTKETIALKKVKPDQEGSGFGALENLLRVKQNQPLLSEHLDFGDIGEKQEDWAELLRFGRLPESDPFEAPKSHMRDKSWTALLKKSVKGLDQYNWAAWYHLGVYYLDQGELEEAKDCLDRSMKLSFSPYTCYPLAILADHEGNTEQAVAYAMECLRILNDDLSVAKSCLKLMMKDKAYSQIQDSYNLLEESIQQDGRILYYYAFALAQTGDLEAAEKLLYKDGCLVVDDMQEGETSLSELYIEIERIKAERAGIAFDKDDVEIPAMFDFRMSRPEKKKK